MLLPRREQAASELLGRQTRYRDDGGAVDVNSLSSGAQSDVSDHSQRQFIEPEFSSRADDAAVKIVLRLKAIVEDESRAQRHKSCRIDRHEGFTHRQFFLKS